jgi:hypothetical protein
MQDTAPNNTPTALYQRETAQKQNSHFHIMKYPPHVVWYKNINPSIMLGNPSIQSKFHTIYFKVSVHSTRVIFTKVTPC